MDNSRKAERKGPKGILNPVGPSHRVFLGNPFHAAPKKVRGQIVKLIEDKLEAIV